MTFLKNLFLTLFLFNSSSVFADTVSIKIQPFIQEKSSWSVNEVASVLKKAQGIFLNCDIDLVIKELKSINIEDAVDEKSLLEFSPSKNFIKLAKETEYLNSDLVIRLFFIKHVGDLDLAGFAYGQSLLEVREDLNSSLLNSAWVTETAKSKTTLSKKHPEYDTAAHELAHVIVNSAHYTKNLDAYYLKEKNYVKRNLLSAASKHQDGSLTSNQCFQARMHEFIIQ